MANGREQVQAVKGMLDDTRIAKDKRQAIDYALRPLAKSGPVTVERIANPNVDPDSYAGGYYWQDRDRRTARNEHRADVAVRAVNIDTLTDYDIRERRSPSAWAPRVELTFEANERQLVGDITADEAVELATALLQAAALVR